MCLGRIRITRRTAGAAASSQYSGLRTDKRVKKFVLERPEALEFVDRFKGLIEFILPDYLRERRPYLSIGIGCTGGRHRSVVIANELARRFKKEGQPVSVAHRDINK